MSPELRAGNASLRADGDETLEAVQAAAAVAGQFLPVDADGGTTVRELLQRRDGGPLDALYGRLRDRVLAAGIDGLSLGSEAVKDVTGYDLRRLLFGSAPVDWAVFRLARLPERRERRLARGGDAFALAEALRADPAAARRRSSSWSPGSWRLPMTAAPTSSRGAASSWSAARARRAPSSRSSTRPPGSALCTGLPTSAVRMAGRDARVTPAGARGRLGLRRSEAPRARHARGPRGAGARRARRRPRARSSSRPSLGSGAAHDGNRSHARRGASASTSSPASACRAASASRTARRSTCWPPNRTARAAGSTSCSASSPAISPSRRRASRSIAASAAAPARRPARRACSTASCSRSPATAARRRPRVQVRALLSFVRAPPPAGACAARRPAARAACCRAPAGRSGGRSIRTRAVTWERRRPGGPPAVVLRGCVMREAFAGAQQAAVDSLAAAGYDVIAGPEQGCCGALHLHNGELATGESMRESAARGRARRRHPRLDGGRLRRRSARARRARARSQRGARASARRRRRAAAAGPWRCSTPATSCTPSGVREAPRELLRGAGYEPVELAGDGRCCGAAGVYAFTQPELSQQLARSRVEAIRASGARVVSCGNPGCALQLRGALREAQLDVRVAHPAELVGRGGRASDLRRVRARAPRAAEAEEASSPRERAERPARRAVRTSLRRTRRPARRGRPARRSRRTRAS